MEMIITVIFLVTAAYLAAGFVFAMAFIIKGAMRDWLTPNAISAL